MSTVSVDGSSRLVCGEHVKRILAHGLLTFIVLAVFGLAAHLLVKLRREPELVPPERVLPAIEVVRVKSATVPISIQANGTVRPRTTTQLTSQVSGQIIEVSDHFEEGGFFDEGDILLRIDPITYQTQLANAQAQLASAQLLAATEEAAVDRAKRDWQRLKSNQPSSDLAARRPQLAKAKADVTAAIAAVASAQHQLQHTNVRAPYKGRVRTKNVDLGQSVSALGVVLADIYAIDYAEVILPLPQDDAWFLDKSSGEVVTLTGRVGGKELASWQGEMDRSSGVVDASNRFLRMIVSVEDPYGLNGGGVQEPLKIGQFINATIPGRAIEQAYELPREALLPGDMVLVVVPKAGDLGNAVIERRTVTIIRKENDRVIVTEGLKDGEYVSVTRLQLYADGMEVTASEKSADGAVSTGQLIQQAAP